MLNPNDINHIYSDYQFKYVKAQIKGRYTRSPSGYYFYRLKTTGEQTGEKSKAIVIYELGGSTHFSENGIITFDALDIDGKQALIQLDVDFSGQVPVISREHTSVISGDVLTDGRVVSSFSSHDVNDSGSIAAVIKPANNSKKHYGSGLYLNDSRLGFERILGVGDKFHQGLYESTGILGDVSLHSGNSLLFEASHLTGSAPRCALFHLPGAKHSASSQIITTGDFINGTDQHVTGFGLIDHVADSHFSITTSHGISTSIQLNAEQNNVLPRANNLLMGHLATPGDHLLLSSGGDVKSSPHTAAVHYGPRVALDGTIYTKIADMHKEYLIAGEKVIKTTDEITSKGYNIDSFTPGCVGPDGVFYYTEYSGKINCSTQISMHIMALNIGLFSRRATPSLTVAPQ